MTGHKACGALGVAVANMRIADGHHVAYIVIALLAASLAVLATIAMPQFGLQQAAEPMRQGLMRSRFTPRAQGHRRYRWLAPIYDAASTERPLYAAARARAIELLHLRPGASVLDVACGTGRNFELIERRIGPSGHLLGIDFTPRMLERAHARVARQGWDNVQLVESDAAQLSPVRLKELGVVLTDAGFDAALCALGFSVIPDWEGAWRAMLSLVRPGGRVVVMDGCFPAQPGDADEVVALRPVAWLLCRAFAADCRREPWKLMERDSDEVTFEHFSWGYVAVAAGTARYSDHHTANGDTW